MLLLQERVQQQLLVIIQRSSRAPVQMQLLQRQTQQLLPLLSPDPAGAAAVALATCGKAQMSR
jgi:hypothetical protein